jgi:hypothetical protein
MPNWIEKIIRHVPSLSKNGTKLKKKSYFWQSA